MNAGETIQVDAERWAKLEEMERKAKLSARRSSVKTMLLAEKAKQAGIVVTKAEIDARIAQDDARRETEATQAA